MKGVHILIYLLFFTGSVLAQSAQDRQCASQELHEYQLQNNPVYRKNFEGIQRKTSDFQNQKQFSRAAVSSTVREIPVVVHILYDETVPAQNLSKAQIESQIAVLNEDFRALNADVSGVPDEFKSVVADYQLTFVLDSITRKSSTVSQWDTDQMKSVATGGTNSITPETHLNIWVCKLPGSTLGYAYFPGASRDIDGVVVIPDAFGSSDYDTENNFYLTSRFDKGRTTTHEIGHYLNLRHIWGDGGCSVDDGVDDTPIAGASNGGCPSYPTKSCTENTTSTSDMYMNYMDYVDDACMFMFSEGQKTRSYSLFEAGGFRENLGQIQDNCNLTAPAGLIVTSKSASTISLSWEAVAEANSYDVSVNETIVNTTTNSILLENLQAGSPYEVTVVGKCATGGSGLSSNIVYTSTVGCYTGSLQLTINTDDYASETSWALSFNGVVVQTDSVDYVNNTTYTEVLDFGEGNYEFEIFDSQSDGICCAFGTGSYSLTDGSGGIIKSGGEFAGSELVSFCVENELIDCNNTTMAAEGDNLTTIAPSLFEFEATETQQYTISSVDKTVVDTDLSIYSDCNTLLAQSDNFGGSQSEITISMSLGQKIFILWEDTHSVEGFDWTIYGERYQEIAFNELTEKTYGDGQFELDAVSSSGLEVSYSSSNISVATIEGNLVSILGAGQTVITASQAGNNDFDAAVPVEQNLIVAKANQAITLTEISDKFTTDEIVEVEANTTSGLGLIYEVSGPATISGSTITLQGITGTVVVTVNQTGTDNFNSASISLTFEVIEDPCLNFTASATATPNPCYGLESGTITVETSSGTAPFTYSLNGAPSVDGNVFSELSSGEYTIEVTDANGCSAVVTTTVESPDALQISDLIVTDVSCAGAQEGAIEVLTTGGQSPFTYSLDNGTSSESNIFEGLAAGEYSITVTDFNNCELSSSITIKSPVAMEVQATVENSTSLDGSGSISLTVTGGIGNYFYNWSNGASGATVENLQVGFYSVTVTDENGCSVEDSFEIGGITASKNDMDKKVLLYPNPVSAILHLQQLNGAENLKLYDARGKLVKTLHLGTETYELNVESLPAGLYFLQLDNRGLKRFLKQ